LQEEYNRQNNITPETIRKAIRSTLESQIAARKTARDAIHASEEQFDATESLADLEKEMLAAAEALDFERAAQIRDKIKVLKANPTLFSGQASVLPDSGGEVSGPDDSRRSKGRPGGKKTPGPKRESV
jgi:excinuclease ABC subunit B